MPKVSVVIPSYNCAPYLGDSIKSILDQSYGDVEIIVVDDASTDNTKAIIDEYLANPKLRYIRNEENKGLMASRNVGIACAEGDLIAFLDADDLFLPNKLKKQVEFFNKDENSVISYANVTYFKDGEDKEILSTQHHFSGDIFYFLKRSNFIAVSTVMARSKIFKSYKFNENLKAMGHGDWEFYLRLAASGTNFTYIDNPLSKIRVRKNAMTTTDGMIESRQEVGLMARDYWKAFKNSMNILSRSGREAIFRYVAMRTKAFIIGFPKGKDFNKPVPQELL